MVTWMSLGVLGRDKIAWYENTDGKGIFGPQQVKTTLADGAQSVYAADLDGDGDMDVLSASAGDDKSPGMRTLTAAGLLARSRSLPHRQPAPGRCTPRT